MSKEVSFDDVRVGDRVRVTRTYEGFVVEQARSGIDLQDGGGKTIFIPNDPDGVTLERIEPEYVPDALYQDDDAVIWLYTPDTPEHPWLKVNTAFRVSFGVPKRPLARLGYSTKEQWDS